MTNTNTYTQRDLYTHVTKVASYLEVVGTDEVLCFEGLEADECFSIINKRLASGDELIPAY